VAWDTTKPCVVLAHHWNRAGSVRVNAFSNCDSVRLLVNGNVIGTKVRNPWSGTGDNEDSGQGNTQLPFQVYWDNVAWQAGTLRAEGINKAGQVLCSDEKITAGAPAAVKLTVEPPLVKPNGETFQVTANGSDASFILATIVDAQGRWCPTATNDITFSITAGANLVEYRGGTCALVTAGQPKGYRSPLDPTLPAEGGMTKIAVKSKFTPGSVTVSATATNLTTGTATYTIYPAQNITVVARGIKATAPSASALTAQIGMFGTSVRYYISKQSNVSLEIMNAGGRVVQRITHPKQTEGWHPIQLGTTHDNAGAFGNGVYFIRLSADGNNQCIKRILFVR
jgi:beta-galactosidase